MTVFNCPECGGTMRLQFRHPSSGLICEKCSHECAQDAARQTRNDPPTDKARIAELEREVKELRGRMSRAWNGVNALVVGRSFNPRVMECIEANLCPDRSTLTPETTPQANAGDECGECDGGMVYVMTNDGPDADMCPACDGTGRSKEGAG